MSIIGDAFMGALDTGRGYLQADIKADAERQKADEVATRQEATDNRKDDMAQRRAIVAEQLKEEFAQNSAKQKYGRLQTEGDAIDTEAGNIDLKRSSGLINSIRNQVPNEGDFANQDLSADDIATIRTKLSPADAEKFYGLKPQTELSKTDDQIAAARKVGAYESAPGLIAQRKQLADTDKQDRLERKNDAETQRKTDYNNAENERKTVYNNAMLDLKTAKNQNDFDAKMNALAIAQAKLDGKSEKETDQFGKISTNLRAVNATLESMNNDGSAFTRKDGVKVPTDAYKLSMELRDKLTKKMKDAMEESDSPAKPSNTAKTSNGLGAPVGQTPDGRMIYMRDGKKVVGK
jgi:hypothetical protein